MALGGWSRWVTRDDLLFAVVFPCPLEAAGGSTLKTDRGGSEFQFVKRLAPSLPPPYYPLKEAPSFGLHPPSVVAMSLGR